MNNNISHPVGSCGGKFLGGSQCDCVSKGFRTVEPAEISLNETLEQQDIESQMVDELIAENQLASLTVGHECGEPCTGTTVLGDGTVLQLRCPYKQLDPSKLLDRKTIGSLWANEVRQALGK